MVNMAQERPQKDQKMCAKKKTFFSMIEKMRVSKETVEILAHDREITGKITEIGEDYLGITFEVEKEVTKHVPTDKGDTIPEKQCVVMLIETFLLFADIKTISRIKNQAAR